VLALGGSLPGNDEVSKSAFEGETTQDAWSEQVRQARLVLQAYPAEKQAEAEPGESRVLPAACPGV